MEPDPRSQVCSQTCTSRRSWIDRSPGSTPFFVAAFGLLAGAAGMAFFSDLTRTGNGLYFAFCGLVAWSGYVGSANRSNQNHPESTCRNWTTWVVALALRVILFHAAPGDDVYRFIWEGKIQTFGFNPYLDGPLSNSLSSFRDDVWLRINHPEWATIYPPGAELLFRSMFSNGIPGWKILAGLADLGIIGLLTKLPVTGTTENRARWYAWNPLFAYLWIGGAHFDSVPVLFLLLAVLLLESSLTQGGDWRKQLASCFLLGLAIATKLFPILLVPIWLCALGRRFLMLFVAFAPLAFAGLFYGFPGTNLESRFLSFADVSRVNDLFWWIYEYFFPSNGHNAGYLRLIVAGSLAILFIYRRNLSFAVDGTLTLLVIASPALHPWYLGWALPIVLRHRVPVLLVALSGTIFFYFTLTSDSIFGPAWQQPWWHHLLVGVPGLIWLLVMKLRWKEFSHVVANG